MAEGFTTSFVSVFAVEILAYPVTRQVCHNYTENIHVTSNHVFEILSHLKALVYIQGF